MGCGSRDSAVAINFFPRIRPQPRHIDFAAVSVAGFIGSISIALIHSVGSKVTNIGTELLAMSLAGSISALPFGTLASMGQYDARRALFSIAGFVVWQVAVGTTLYWFTYRNALIDAPSALS